MNEDIFISLKNFIIETGWGYSFPFIKQIEITEKTRLKEDLKINGDDADEFLVAFGKKFGVNVSQFRIDEYFDDEGEPVLRAIIRIFTGKKKKQKKTLTIKHLENAITTGWLDEKTIKGVSSDNNDKQ